MDKLISTCRKTLSLLAYLWRVLNEIHKQLIPHIQLAITKSNKDLCLRAFVDMKSDQYELYFDVLNFSLALFQILALSGQYLY